MPVLIVWKIYMQVSIVTLTLDELLLTRRMRSAGCGQQLRTCESDMQSLTEEFLTLILGIILSWAVSHLETAEVVGPSHLPSR